MITTDKDAPAQDLVIAKALGFIPIPNKPIRNPFREDKRPGAFFTWRKGKLRLQDYADEKTHGMDCWDIYMKVYGISNLNDAIQHYTGGKPITKVNLPNYYPPTFEFRVGFTPMEFDQRGLDYWQDYGITKEQLIADGVHQVRSYHYNSKYSDLLEVEVTPEDICFALPSVGGRNKIYRPLTDQKSLKWKADMLPGAMWYLRSSEEPAEVCFITSSYKDGRVVFNFDLGVDVMAPAVSESAPAEDIAGWPLMKRLKIYKLVILGMDFDRAGHAAEDQWAAALRFHEIPHKLMKIEELKLPEHRIKDYAAMEKHSPDTCKIVKELIHRKITT